MTNASSGEVELVDWPMMLPHLLVMPLYDAEFADTISHSTACDFGIYIACMPAGRRIDLKWLCRGLWHCNTRVLGDHEQRIRYCSTPAT